MLATLKAVPQYIILVLTTVVPVSAGSDSLSLAVAGRTELAPPPLSPFPDFCDRLALGDWARDTATAPPWSWSTQSSTNLSLVDGQEQPANDWGVEM